VVTAPFEGSREHEAARRYPLDAYLGVDYPEPVIKATLSLNNIPFRESADIAEDLAGALAAGKVVAILHGRDEWGPRSLGARSILADPRAPEMKDHLNAKIKFREEFRPFAPVVKKEAYGEWFETLGMAESPFMLYTHKALRPDQTAAVTHVDGTSRVQTVSAEQNPYLYRVLDAFERRTGVPVLINTSFNLRGEPIVSSPSDALKTFFASGIDALAIVAGDAAQSLGARGDALLLVRIAGPVAAVRRLGRALREIVTCRDVGNEVWERVAALPLDSKWTARVAWSPGARPPLEFAGYSAVVYPANGAAYLLRTIDRPTFRRVRDSLEALDGYAVLERAGRDYKREAGGAWGKSRVPLPIARALKERFDPRGVLAPGRMPA